MKDNWEQRMLQELADKKAERENEIKINPLSKYSTTELKNELRRRKRN